MFDLRSIQTSSSFTALAAVDTEANKVVSGITVPLLVSTSLNNLIRAT